MDVFTNGYYKKIRILLIASGLWPDSSRPLKILMRAIVIIVAYTILLPQLQYVKRPDSSMNDVVLVGVFQLAILIIFLKSRLFEFHMDDIRYEIDLIREDWKILSGTSTIDIIHDYAKRGCVGSNFYTSLGFFAGVTFFLLPIYPVALDIIIPQNVSRTRLPAINVDYSIYGLSGEHFYLGLMHGLMLGMTSALLLTSVDSFVVIGAEHCCGLFKVTGFILQKLHKGCSPIQQNNIICRAVFIHKRAIALAELVESNFTMTAGVEIAGVMTLISITALLALFRRNEPTECFRYLMLTFCEVVNLFLWSLPGQDLFDHSSQLFETIYLCDWTFLTDRNKKLLLIMMMRSIKPSCLTAGKFYFLNLENFKNVLQGSFSYLTVFLSIG